MLNAEDYIYKLYSYFEIEANNKLLAKKINTTPQTISNWKQRDAISAIKKKCRELGIYNDIFDDINIQNNSIQNTQYINTNDSLHKLDDDIDTIYRSILPFLKNESNKNSFKQYLKEWFVKEMTNI